MKGQERLIDIPYESAGVKASHPWFDIEHALVPDQERAALWNRLILDDFFSILQIYSFQPFPLPAPAAAGPVPTLNLSSAVKRNDANLISILYTAHYSSPYSAHPSELIYTTNIDKRKNLRLRLPDLVQVTPGFVQNFRTWKLVTKETNPEVLKAMEEYLSTLSNEELLMAFQSADIITNSNPWGAYSYVTPTELGISLLAPNYLGDHLEYEKPLNELTGFLKRDFSY